MTDPIYIKVPVSCYYGSACDKAPDYIKESYDISIVPDLLKVVVEDDTVAIPLGLDLLAKHIKKIREDEPNRKIVTIGGDSSIIAPVTTSMNESFMVIEGDKVSSPLWTIVVASNPNLHNFNTFNNTCLHRMSLGSTLGLVDPPLNSFKLLGDPSKILYIGLNDVDSTESSLLDELGIINFTTDKINMIGMDAVIESIKALVENNPINLCISMTAFNKKTTKCVTHENLNGMDFDQITKLVSDIKDQVKSLTITDFDTNSGLEKHKNLTGELCRQIIVQCMNLKQKRLNIFSEDTEFLIYRHSEQEDEDTDYGWYILRGMDIDTKNKLISNIKGKIIEIEVDGEDCLVTTTTINEQSTKTYYMCNGITDTVLFPQEKQNMMFELIN